jgi:hypothetical protein
MHFKWQLLSILLLSTSFLALAQTISPFFADGANGTISGTVLDGRGQVAEDAQICLSVTSRNGTSSTEIQTSCTTSTNKYGQFQIEHLKIGTYTVFAKDAADQSSIEDEKGQTVTLTATAPYTNLTMRLKTGGILLGSVTDAVSGKPVEQFRVQYEPLDEEGGGTAFANHGHFRTVVPVATDLVVIVTAPGYKGWVYTDSENSSRPTLRVASGEQKQLEIQLDPLPPGSASGHGNSASPSH